MQRLFLIMYLFHTITAHSQHSKVCGHVINPFDENSKTVLIYAKSFNAETLYETMTDSLGNFCFDSLKYDDYKIYVQGLGIESRVDTLRLNTPKKNLNINFPDCPSANKSGVCPFCNKKDRVVSIAPHFMFDLWFKTAKDSLEYYKKQKTRGYQIEEGKLIWIKNKEEEIKFRNPCYNWFCEREKKVF